jgi:SAM-dependent methyltransferase
MGQARQLANEGERSCRICGQHAPCRPIGQASNGYPFFQCQSCETVLVEHQPDPAELKRAYDRLFEKGEYERHRREFEMMRSGWTPKGFYRPLLLRRATKSARGRRLIEIGGGTGSFGVLATSRGWSYTDYDISEVAVGFAKQLDLDAQLFDVKELPPLAPQSADVIVMWEVIEHVWNVHEYVRTISTSLLPGGVFLFSTPNYRQPDYQKNLRRGFPSSPPVHLNFFDEDSLQKVLLANDYFSRIDIVKRRLYRPRRDLGAITKFLKQAAGLDEVGTLYGIATARRLPPPYLRH